MCQLRGSKPVPAVTTGAAPGPQLCGLNLRGLHKRGPPSLCTSEPWAGISQVPPRMSPSCLLALQDHLHPTAILRHCHLSGAELRQHIFVLRQQPHRELIQAAGIRATRVPAGECGAQASPAEPHSDRDLFCRAKHPCLAGVPQCSHFTDKEAAATEKRELGSRANAQNAPRLNLRTKAILGVHIVGVS